MPISNKLIETARAEWEFFGRGEINLDGTEKQGRKEYVDGAYQRVGDYWKFIGGPHKNLTGKDRGTPWSAAFISFCFNEAGAAAKFPYSAGHATYINAAIKNAGASGAKPIIGHKVKDYSPKPGDLIGYWRGATKVSYETARQIGWYESHTDIVVEIGNGFLYSIGGNVRHSVTRSQFKIDANGRLTDKSQNWFVVIENKI
ncbi:MAG: hypothetical protein DCF16_13425 [Alphaproteobacteria bacterium]|nr:MAG: hypothetical protein DCF16_13425 [Alphaproteobacteria bacterium]